MEDLKSQGEEQEEEEEEGIEDELLMAILPLDEKEDELKKRRDELLNKVESEEVIERKVRHLNGELDKAVYQRDQGKEQALREQLADINKNNDSLKTQIAEIDSQLAQVKGERDVLVAEYCRSTQVALKEQFIEEMGEVIGDFDGHLGELRAIVEKYGVQLNPSFFRNDSRFFDELPWRKVRDRLTYLFGFQG